VAAMTGMPQALPSETRPRSRVANSSRCSLGAEHSGEHREFVDDRHDGGQVVVAVDFAATMRQQPQVAVRGDLKQALEDADSGPRCRCR